MDIHSAAGSRSPSSDWDLAGPWAPQRRTVATTDSASGGRARTARKRDGKSWNVLWNQCIDGVPRNKSARKRNWALRRRGDEMGKAGISFEISAVMTPHESETSGSEMKVNPADAHVGTGRGASLVGLATPQDPGARGGSRRPNGCLPGVRSSPNGVRGWGCGNIRQVKGHIIATSRARQPRQVASFLERN